MAVEEWLLKFSAIIHCQADLGDFFSKFVNENSFEDFRLLDLKEKMG